MKKIYLVLVAMVFCIGANAQNFTYTLDSTFNNKGYLILKSLSTNDIVHTACYLNNDNTMFVVSDFGAFSNHYSGWTKYKSTGKIDSTLCSSYCVSTGQITGSSYDIHKVRNDYFIPHTGFGGTVIHGINSTTVDNQVYNPGTRYMTCSAMLNDSVVIEGGNEAGPGVFAYTAQAPGSGYLGWSGHFLGTGYPHGDFITLPIATAGSVYIQAIGVQSDKKILVAGHFKVDSTEDIFVARFKFRTLTLDSTFGTNGIFRMIGTKNFGAAVYSMLIMANDSIYLNYLRGNGASGTTYLTKLLPNGAFTPNFGFNGETYAGTHKKMLITNDNKLMLAGNFNRFAECRNLDGSMFWTGFSNSSCYLDGTTYLPSAYNYFDLRDVKSNANGDILLVGTIDSSGLKCGIMVRLKKVLISTTEPDGINQIAELSNVKIFPNPALTSISFIVDLINKNATASIYSVVGNLISSHEINGNKTEINIQNLPKGVYVLQIKNGNQVNTSKFIKE
jgi:hypothetical protein